MKDKTKRYFPAIVHHDADSAYGATFPDLPGCFAASDTRLDLMPNCMEALALWFQDQPLTEPSSPDDVWPNKGDGQFIILVPY